MKININKDLILEESITRTSNIDLFIFGENHFKLSEVKRIQQEIINYKPDILLHELYWEDEEFYKKYGITCIPLEDEVKLSFNLKEQFMIREQSMIKHLSQVLTKYNKIAILVGDTHLRSIIVPELGNNIFRKYCDKIGANIVRSKYKEIM